MTYTVLVVEDDDDIRDLVELMLRSEGYIVRKADNGEAALRLIAELAIDLVILDIMLPDISGWEVCRRLRAHPRATRLPILIFTVRSDIEDFPRSEHELADGIISKPFERASLLAMVKQLLETGAPV